MPSDVDPQILWETTKCAIRGFCISFSSTLAKAKTHQFTQLENKIQSLQNLQKRLSYVRNPRSLIEGTETLCRDDIGDLLGSPNHL